MSTHKYMDRICVAAVTLSLLLTIIFMNGKTLGFQSTSHTIGYEDRLFDNSRVHTIDIVMDDWDGFIETCQNEEYSNCNVVIDGENYSNVGIRGKGNTSLTSVAAMGSSRYSFKVEFDKYDGTKSYHGLDKLSLNNLIQDNTMMKDYLTYQLMNEFGVAAPLCSFVYITVNGEDWGLYLAVEGVEESFLQRSYGKDYGNLYKPDSMSFGGGRGNGRNFNAEDFDGFPDGEKNSVGLPDGENGDFPPMPPDRQPDFDGSDSFPQHDENGKNIDNGKLGGAPGGFGSAEDVKLNYIDDDPDSYSNIFDNAKTDISKADKTRLISSLQSLSNFEDLENVVDIESVLRYFVVHNFVVNEDSYTGSMIHNYYLYEKDGMLSMIPWDYNLALGTFRSGGAATSAVNDPIDEELSDRPMQAWIFSDESYTQQYHELYSEFLSAVDTDQIIDNAYKLIADYVEKDPTKFCTYEEFEAGVQSLKSFCELRKESIKGQLTGTVPSTEEEQNSNSSALVDASELNLSEMGTMDRGGGPGGFGGSGKPGEREQPRENKAPENAAAPERNAVPGQNSIPEQSSVPGQGDAPERFYPPGEQEQVSSDSLQSSVTLLGASGLILAVGLLIVYKYKK